MVVKHVEELYLFFFGRIMLSLMQQYGLTVGDVPKSIRQSFHPPLPPLSRLTHDSAPRPPTPRSSHFFSVNEAIYDRYPVNCSVDSWQYLVDNNVTYKSNVTFPDGNDTEVTICWKIVWQGDNDMKRTGQPMSMTFSGVA